LPELKEPVKQFIEATPRYTLGVKGTKAGGTVGCAEWLISKTWNNAGTRGWWTGPVYRQTRIGWNRCCDLLPKELIKIKETTLEIFLPNGSIIEGRTGEDPDNLLGEEVHFAVVDEAPRFREEAFNNLRTTLSVTRGPIKAMGNPKGRNWFFRLYGRGHDPAYPEYKSFCMPSAKIVDGKAISLSPYMPDDEVEDAHRLMPSNAFAELYLAEFIEDSAGVFRNVKACIRGQLEKSDHVSNYGIGLDLAKHEDFTVEIIGNRSTNQVIAFKRFNRLAWPLQKKMIIADAKEFNDAQILMDATGIGDPIYDDLIAAGLKVEPYTFTSEKKQQLIEGLAVDIEQENIHFPDIPELINELQMFEYRVMPRSGKLQYTAPEGYHDDCVVALALFNRLCGSYIPITASMGGRDRIVRERSTDRVAGREEF